MNSEPRLEMRKPPTRAKWRSSTSACKSALEKGLTPPTLLEMAIFRQLSDYYVYAGGPHRALSLRKVGESEHSERDVA